MKPQELQQQVLNLPEADRLALAEAVWASLDNPDAFELPAWQREILQQRLATVDKEEGEPWEAVRAELWPELA